MLYNDWYFIEGTVSSNKISVARQHYCPVYSLFPFIFFFRCFNDEALGKEIGMTSLVCLHQNMLVKNHFQSCFDTACGQREVEQDGVWCVPHRAVEKRTKPRKTSFVRLGIVAGLSYCKVIARKWNNKDHTRRLPCLMNVLDYRSATIGTRLEASCDVYTSSAESCWR